MKWYTFWKIKKYYSDSENYSLNPREIYVKQAEISIVSATTVWFFAINLLFFEFQLYIAMIIWSVALILSYVYLLPRYFWWRN